MSFSLDSEFQNVDEAPPSEEDSLKIFHTALTPTVVPDAHCVYVSRPAEPESEIICLSDSGEETDQCGNVTGQFGNPGHPNVVQKLYLQQQLRDKEVAMKRKEKERLELKDCTFQPNIHLRKPEGNSKKFIREQETFEARRKTRLEALAKEKEAKALEREKATGSFHPHIDPASVVIAKRVYTGKRLIDRLLTPKRAVETVPEVVLAHHPLVSPKAQRLKRDAREVHEHLYLDSKKESHPPPAAPNFTASHHSELLVLRHLRSSFSRACSSLSLPDPLSFPHFQSLLCVLKFSTEQDSDLMQDCWKTVAGDSQTVSLAKVAEMLEAAATLRHDTSPSFRLMHKDRLGSPSKYHQHLESWTHQPHIDQGSRAMVHRSDYLAALEEYDSRSKARKALQLTEIAAAQMDECSFSPKLNKYRDVNPLIQKIRSMSPDREVRADSPRYEVLHRYGVLLREERRLQSPPDHEYEEHAKELTFAPQRFASTSPRRRRDYPASYSKTVERLKTAYSHHLDVMRMLTRGELLKSPVRKRERREETVFKPVLKGRTKAEEEETTAATAVAQDKCN